MQPYLTTNGQKIYQVILKHIDRNKWSMDIDDYELSMLANCFDTYERCALAIQTLGMTQEAKGGIKMARPEVAIMDKCYAAILKHSSKFGLNPGDRKRIFNIIETKKSKKDFRVFWTDRDQFKREFIEWWKDTQEGEPNMSYLEGFSKYVTKHKEEPPDLLTML